MRGNLQNVRLGWEGRITKTVANATLGDTVYNYYYNEHWQIVQVDKKAGTYGSNQVYEQYVWDQRYIDTPILRCRDTNNDGVADETLYYLGLLPKTGAI